MSEHVLPQRDSYFKPWLVTIALVAGAWFGYGKWTKIAPMPPFPVPAPVEQTSNHYFILRMPPITSQFESGIETMRVRYGEWLDALKAAGYRPILFSEIRRLTSEGAGLPPKSVVVMFEPGFRRTYGIIAPILQSRDWPAVWMTDKTAMDLHHREYITYHTARNMVASGGWDVGLKTTQGIYVFEVGQDDKFQIGQRAQGTWAPMSGGTALNHRGPMSSLNCLNVKSDWLAKDLVNRLESELPVETPVYFSVGDVQNLTWGMTRNTPTTFDLAAEPQQRSAVVSWLGTKGLDNCKVRLRGHGLAGTMSVRLRWDEVTVSGLQISITPNRITIQDWKNGTSRAIYRANRPFSTEFMAIAMLVGDRLALSIDGSGTVPINAPLTPGNGKGVAQVYLHDGVLGAARVSGVQIYYEPLPQSAVIFSSGSDAL